VDELRSAVRSKKQASKKRKKESRDVAVKYARLKEHYESLRSRVCDGDELAESDFDFASDDE
jgi:hypothetical protein